MSFYRKVSQMYYKLTVDGYFLNIRVLKVFIDYTDN